MIGAVIAGLMVAAWSTDVPYVVNAVTFLLSAAFVSAHLGDQAPVGGLADARALARCRRRPEARRHRTTAPHGARRVERRARRVGRGERRRGRLRQGHAGCGQRWVRSARRRERSRPRHRKLPQRPGTRARRPPAELHRLAGAHGGRVGRRSVERLDLAGRRVRGRRGSRERLGRRLQSTARPARSARSVSRPRARDDHELELRRSRARHGRRRSAYGCGGRTRCLDRRGRDVPRRGRRRSRHDAMAAGRDGRRRRSVRGELGIGGRGVRTVMRIRRLQPSRSARTAHTRRRSNVSQGYSRRSRRGAKPKRSGLHSSE